MAFSMSPNFALLVWLILWLSHSKAYLIKSLNQHSTNCHSLNRRVMVKHMCSTCYKQVKYTVISYYVVVRGDTGGTRHFPDEIALFEAVIVMNKPGSRLGREAAHCEAVFRTKLPYLRPSSSWTSLAVVWDEKQHIVRPFSGRNCLIWGRHRHEQAWQSFGTRISTLWGRFPDEIALFEAVIVMNKPGSRLGQESAHCEAVFRTKLPYLRPSSLEKMLQNN